MALENIVSISYKNNSDSSASLNTNELLVSKAKALGIDVKKYYVYDEQGNQTGIDYSKLNMAINLKKEEQNNISNNNSGSDTFYSSMTETQSSVDNNKKEAKNSKKEIENNFDDAVKKYSEFFDIDAKSTTQEGKIAKQWEEAEAKANKLTSVTASDTTILEGVKEFITKLTNLVNDTKNFKASEEFEADKESAISLNTLRDLQERQNKISVYTEDAEEENILGNNPFLKSAFETTDDRNIYGFVF